jgi:hypothetical protein
MNQIKTLKELIQAADDRKAVYSKSGRLTGSRKPAAFVVNYTARVIYGLLEEGLFLYIPKEKDKE